MEQPKEQKIKRVTIELEDGTTFYDGKPDLIYFIIENKYGKKANCKGGSFINEEVATSGMIAYSINELEKLTARLAHTVLLQMIKEEASKEKTND